MNKNSLLLSAVCAATLLTAQNTSRIELEWNCRNDVSVPREVAIDRIKLDKLAGIPQDRAIEVVAVTATGEVNTQAVALAGNTPGKEILRFNVPEKTHTLYARVAEGKTKTACSKTQDNILAGAFDNLKQWNYSPSQIKIYRSGDNLRLDVNKLNWCAAKYFQTLPDGYAGTSGAAGERDAGCHFLPSGRNAQLLLPLAVASA